MPPTSFLNVLIEKVLLSIEAVRLESFNKDDLALFCLSLVVLPDGRLQIEIVLIYMSKLSFSPKFDNAAAAAAAAL